MADGQSKKPQPGCVDCHQGHDEPYHLAEGYRLTLPNRCGNCHADLLLGYHVSMHGQLTQLGYEAAAKCSDCHGAHDTLAISNPQSRLSPENRLETCRQCHENAVANFAEFNPHANHKDERRFAGLHHLYSRIDVLIYLLFGFFLLHAILWYGRSLLSTLRYGRDRTFVTDQIAVVRFSPQDTNGVSVVARLPDGVDLHRSADSIQRPAVGTQVSFDRWADLSRRACVTISSP